MEKSLYRFMIVGVTNTLLGIGVIYVAWYFLGIGDIASNALGYAVGFIWGYVLNRTWTFDDADTVARSLWRYMVVCALAYSVNLSCVLAARSVIGASSFLPHIFGVMVYTTLAYLGSRYFAFYKR